MNPTAAERDLVLACADLVLDAWHHPECDRPQNFSMAVAANEFAMANGGRTITTVVIEQLLPLTAGHSDCDEKIALYIAEYVMRWRNAPGENDEPTRFEHVAGHQWVVGQECNGFMQGAFNSYGDRRIEAVGADWVVARHEDGRPEFASPPPKPEP